MQGLRPGRPGRPRAGPSPEIPRLRQRIKALEQQLETTEQVARLRQIVHQMNAPRPTPKTPTHPPASVHRRRGPPLFLKRDNGGVFNTPEVDALLAQFAVIPLNSPTRYPRYNGAIEHGIGELKHDLQSCLPRPTPSAPSVALPFTRFLVYKHNDQPRRLLGGQSATQAYFQRPRLRWNRRECHQIFAWIGARAKRMLHAMDHPNRRDLRRSWRRAAETWLRRQGLIEVSINHNTVTPFSPKMAS